MRTIDLANLRATFQGELLTVNDGARFDEARAVFNGMFERRPLLIARPRNAEGIVTALAFARDQGLPLAVRAGGHSVAGYSTVDEGVLIDLRLMKSIRVDPATRRAWVQSGVTWGEFDGEAQKVGLATTGGRMSTTGVAGFTLGSGSGWLERLHGLACDNLLAAKVVTADGSILTANPTENKDLFWGLKGGGGNFGIVTEFEFQLHPVGPMILGGLLLYPREKAHDLIRFYRDVMPSAQPELGGGIVLLTAPFAPFVPPELQGKPAVAMVAAWFGAMDRGELAMARLRAPIAPAVDLISPMPYVAFQSLLDAGNPPGRRNYWRSENLASLPDAGIDTLIRCASLATSPFSVLILIPQGGKLAEVPEDETPLGGRQFPWQYHCYGIWEGTEDVRHIGWVRETEQAMRPWTAGRISMNFVSEATPDRVRTGFSQKSYERLLALKKTYDPTNLFRLNQNIPPV